MKKEKTIVEMPPHINIVFLLNSKADVEELGKIFEANREKEILVANGLKIVYRKDTWDVVETL